jgi:hypothetical protein
LLKENQNLVILQLRLDNLMGDGGHHRAALDAVIFDDAPCIFLRGITGIFIGDGVKDFLLNKMLGGREQRGKADEQVQKDFHADESTGKLSIGKRLLLAANGREIS